MDLLVICVSCLSLSYCAALWSPAVALLCVVFLSLSQYDVLGQVWYLIVSIPDLCLLPYFNICFGFWSH